MGDKTRIDKPNSYYLTKPRVEGFYNVPGVEKRRGDLIRGAGLALIAHILHSFHADPLFSYGAGGLALFFVGKAGISKLREKNILKGKD